MELGEKIHSLRISHGMTLEELGNKVGVGKSTVRKWETGMITSIRSDKIEKIAAALDTYAVSNNPQKNRMQSACIRLFLVLVFLGFGHFLLFLFIRRNVINQEMKIGSILGINDFPILPNIAAKNFPFGIMIQIFHGTAPPFFRDALDFRSSLMYNESMAESL